MAFNDTKSTGDTVTANEWNTMVYNFSKKSANYIIFKDGSVIKSLNGFTGNIDYTGSDFATVLQNSINNLTSGRNWIEKILIRGSFELTDCIEVPSYTEIELIGKIRLGNNQASNLEFPKHTGQYGMFYIGDEANGASHIIIHGGEIDGNKSNNSGTNFYGITFRKVSYGYAFNIKLHDTGESGIVFEYGSDTGWIKDCHVYNTGYDGMGCGGFDTINHDIYFINNKITGTIPHNGITVEKSNYRIFILGNLVDFTTETAGNSGINIGGAYDVIIQGNHVKCSNQHGIRIDGDLSYKGYNVQIVGNNIFGAQYRGILLSRNVSDIVVSNNIITNVSNGYGIVLWDYGQTNGTPVDVIIDGNRIHTCDNYGIYLLDGDYVRITHNDVRNNTQGGILIDSGFGSNRSIFGNLGYKTESSGTSTISNGNTSVVVNHGLSGTPNEIILTGSHSEVKDVYVNNITSTQFTINVDSAVTADRDVYWVAYYRP